MKNDALTGAIARGPSVRQAKRIIRAQPRQGWVDLALTYGKNFIYQGGLATCDPAVAQTLLMQRVHTQHRSAAYKLAARLMPGAPGVLFMEGDEWHKHVQAVMPVFTRAHVDAYTQCIHETVVQQLATWPDGQPLADLYQSITELGLQVVLRVGYGLDPTEELARCFGQELLAYKHQTMNDQARIDEFGFSLDQLRHVPAFLKRQRLLRSRMNRLNGLVQRILDHRQRHNHQGVDWINQLSKAEFPLAQITDELNHIYGAFNAIDYAITCALVELSRQPHWATVLRDEWQAIRADRAYPTRADFAALPNTMYFMKEVFRYYPVAIAVLRRTGEPLAVAGAVWPPGKEVFIMLQSMHHHPDFWDHPERFDPDRWKQPLREPRAYIPFLTGPRQCIGRHLTELHFVVTLHAILQKFDVQVLSSDIAVSPYLIPRFAQPLPARMQAVQ